MKAAVVRDFREGPRYDDFELPAGEGVAVDVSAAALSPRVRSAATGEHYTSRGALPLVPGIDGVGKLVDGRRVYFLAANDTMGSMAERTLAHEKLLVALPDHLDSSVVAAAMLPAISSWVALTKRVSITKGQRVLVLGATGAAGRLAVQIAKHLGAGEVIAVGRDEAALAHVAKLGADRVVRLIGTKADRDAVAEVASEVDIVLDYLSGEVASALMPAICRRRETERALRWVLIGAVAGDELALSSVLLRKRNLHILGSGQGAVSTAEMFGVVPDVLAALPKLDVAVREVPLAEVERWWSERLASGERLVFVPRCAR